MNFNVQVGKYAIQYIFPTKFGDCAKIKPKGATKSYFSRDMKLFTTYTYRSLPLGLRFEKI